MQRYEKQTELKRGVTGFFSGGWKAWFKVQSCRFKVPGSRFQVPGSKFKVQR
jgi:hypothetical protein